MVILDGRWAAESSRRVRTNGIGERTAEHVHGSWLKYGAATYWGTNSVGRQEGQWEIWKQVLAKDAIRVSRILIARISVRVLAIDEWEVMKDGG